MSGIELYDMKSKKKKLKVKFQKVSEMKLWYEPAILLYKF